MGLGLSLLCDCFSHQSTIYIYIYIYIYTYIYIYIYIYNVCMHACMHACMCEYVRYRFGLKVLFGADLSGFVQLYHVS